MGISICNCDGNSLIGAVVHRISAQSYIMIAQLCTICNIPFCLDFVPVSNCAVVENDRIEGLNGRNFRIFRVNGRI